MLGLLLQAQLTLLQLVWLLLKSGGFACTSQTNVPSTCAACMANQLTLTRGDGTTTTTPTVSAITFDANGCALITVTCTAVNGGMTFMQFNVNQGGPINPTGTIVMAQLNCVNGQWVYMQAGVSRVVTEVNCQNT